MGKSAGRDSDEYRGGFQSLLTPASDAVGKSPAIDETGSSFQGFRPQLQIATTSPHAEPVVRDIPGGAPKLLKSFALQFLQLCFVPSFYEVNELPCLPRAFVHNPLEENPWLGKKILNVG